MKKNLWYINRFGEYYLVKTNIADEELFTEIKRYIVKLNPGFKIYYVRSWLEGPNITRFDVGSHSEFFEVRPSSNPPEKESSI
jgi:hypothetical protein